MEPYKKHKLTNAIIQLPENVRRTYDQQENFARDHFICVCISISWVDYVNKVLKSTHNLFNTELLGRKFVSINFKYILVLGDYQYKEEQGCNELDIETKLKDKLNE